uniref:PX domain-containing protein n=1 Tax=Globisporangium ultimum (strain ATCC 200006 / CBS 805.95 / DAOM BR144) TaxID=431595 RepID=K3XAL7_GLOUD
MSGIAHVLDATITSALALKPSTVYIICVENTKTNDKWHLRKCFSEFCELREKVITLIEGTSCSTSSGSSTPASISSSYDSHTSSSSGSDSSVLSDLHSHSSSTSSSNSCSERFPYLYKQFPRRQLFGSRFKKVIEQRTHALSLFLRQVLLFAREIKQQNQIAVYFSMTTFLESFFECAAHSGKPIHDDIFNFSNFSLNLPSTLAKTQAAAAVAAKMATMPAGFNHCRHQQQRAFHTTKKAFTLAEDEYSDDDELSSDRDSTEEENAPIGPLLANNFNFARRFYQEYGKNVVADEDEDDDDEEMKLVLSLKKSSSCIVHRELEELKMHLSGNHYASMQPTEAVSAADAWAARVEIAGITSAAAARGGKAPATTTCASSHRSHVPSSSKLAISANRAVQYHQQQKQKLGAATSLNQKKTKSTKQSTQSHDQLQEASIVYATHPPQTEVVQRDEWKSVQNGLDPAECASRRKEVSLIVLCAMKVISDT